MVSGIQQLYTAKDLIFAWTYRTVRARYQQSLLGGLWAIIQPAAAVGIFSIIFTFFVPVDTGGIPYVVFSSVAMVPWSLFTTSVADMADSLVGNMNLVTKIYFPREVLPFSAMLARLVDFAISMGFLVLLMIIYRIPFYPLGWAYLPVIVLTQILLAVGLGLAGAALNVFYRDIRHIIALGLQIWFYASPIIYPVSAVPERFRPFYYLNPMAGVIEAYRSVLLQQQLPGAYLSISACAAIIVFLVGYWLFKRLEFQFADVV
ncbi:MAG TPA: ABC transporter permease [Caldilineaceae bacterium]|nr:ABC transporter permease [Caldilineaceae bacterium]